MLLVAVDASFCRSTASLDGAGVRSGSIFVIARPPPSPQAGLAARAGHGGFGRAKTLE